MGKTIHKLFLRTLSHFKRLKMQSLQSFAPKLPSNELKITLCDQSLGMARAWKAFFGGVANVEMPYATSAEQMRTAFDNVYLEGWKKVVHPALALYSMRK